MNDTNDNDSKPLVSFSSFDGTFITHRLHLVSSHSSHPKVVLPEDDNHTNTHLAIATLTPLLEYKLRQAFATPSLVLTFYFDLTSSHDLVLMCGEITPSAATKPTTRDYLLSQHDAHLLAHGLQRFYLWDSSREREKLLSEFHRKTGHLHVGGVAEACRLRGLGGEPYRLSPVYRVHFLPVTLLCHTNI